MPSMRILDYTIRNENNTHNELNNKSTFATKDDINVLQEQINDFRDKIESISARQSKKKDGADK